MVNKTYKIKKFQNKKLYDLELSEHTNLEHIEELVILGQFVEVKDSEGKDITPIILADCVAKRVRRLISRTQSSKVQAARFSFLLRQMIQEV